MYHVVRPEDVDRFDELLYKREEQKAMLKSKALPKEIKFKGFFSKHDSSESNSFDDGIMEENVDPRDPGPGANGFSNSTQVRSESAGARGQYFDRLNADSLIRNR